MLQSKIKNCKKTPVSQVIYNSLQCQQETTLNMCTNSETCKISTSLYKNFRNISTEV